MDTTPHHSIAARRACATALMITSLMTGAVTVNAQESSLAERTRLTGDWGGIRTALEEKGIDVVVQYVGETLGVSGGTMAGGSRAAFEGRFDMTVNTDLEKLVGWTGAKTHIRAFQIHNANGKNAATYTGSIADPSNIDAIATTRLFTAWIQQEFGTVASIRIGQLAADDEFLASATASSLINGTFGWAGIMAANLPSGGPAYPLATPGVRLQINPTENLSLLGAVFAGDPAGKNCYTTGAAVAQLCNKHGTTFSLDGGAFWLGEAQYNANQGADAKGLAASYKIGGWYHSGNFVDQRYGIDTGTGDVIPLGGGFTTDPISLRGNLGVYGVVDQMFWRGADSSASLFVRAGAVNSDRSLVSWYVDGGIGLKGFVPGRAADTFTIGVAHAHISEEAIAADNFYSASGWPRRSGETVLELSYIAQISPCWNLQPDFQYISKPAGGNLVADDDSVVDDAFVFGVRTTVTF